MKPGYTYSLMALGLSMIVFGLTGQHYTINHLKEQVTQQQGEFLALRETCIETED